MRIRITTRWNRDPEAGSVLVFWGVAIVVLLGMVALSFDIGRISATQSELQSYADNLAVAAAAELDGKDDSIARAATAAATLITDSQTFGAGGRQLTAADYRLEFFERGITGLGPAINGADGFSEAEQVSARYVRAVVGPRNVGTPFAAVLSLISGNALVSTDVGAQAAAGLDQYACDIAPLFFCTSSDWAGAENHIGEMVRLRTGDKNAAWGPGNFGFLDPDDEELNPNGPCASIKNQTERKACLIASEQPITACFRQDGVDTEPGQKTGNNASPFNVFFDIYEATMQNGEKHPTNMYAPAPVVVKGIEAKAGKACITGKYVATGAVPLPRDTCLNAGTCSPDARFGDGNWDRTAYINTNHAGADPTATHAMTGNYAGTRYEMYRAEVELAKTALTQVAGETVGPTCNPVASSNVNRRVLTVAAIDCGDPDVADKLDEAKVEVKGRARDVPVEEFVRIFLTEPVGYPVPTAEADTTTSDSFDIHVEILGSAEKESIGIPAQLRKVVRLVE